MKKFIPMAAINILRIGFVGFISSSFQTPCPCQLLPAAAAPDIDLSLSSASISFDEILSNTFLASSDFPFMMSQRGDSGIVRTPNPTAIAGIPASPSMILQLMCGGRPDKA